MAMKQIMILMKPLKVYTKKKLKSLFSSKAPATPPIYAFMNITLKIDVESPGWQKIVNKVLMGIQGVAHLNMEDDGTVTIAGTVNPPLLLKRLGKAGAKILMKHWQYGQCSTNLWSIPNAYSYNHRNYYQGNNMYYPQGRGYDYPTYCGNNNMYYPQGRGYDYPTYGGNNNMYYPQGPGYDYPTYSGNGYNYPANRGYGNYYPRGNNYSYAQYADDDYGYSMNRNNGYGYGGCGGSSRDYGHGHEYGCCGY